MEYTFLKKKYNDIHFQLYKDENKDKMKFFSIIIRYSTDVSSDCKIQYEKHQHYYRVCIDKETNEFSKIEDALTHFEFVTRLLSIDEQVEEIMIFITSYPTISLKKYQLKDKQIHDMLKNLITFEFRDI